VRAPLRPLNSEEKRAFQTMITTLKRSVAHVTSGAN